MFTATLYDSFKRYRTLQTSRITSLPIVILMPHSACNCRCIMCDIWKANQHLKQLNEADVSGLLSSLKKLGTKQIVFSGGEALLNPNFFRFCEILKNKGLKLTLLSSGLTLKQYAARLVSTLDEIIVSLDGNEAIHDKIRNIPGAFKKLAGAVEAIKNINPTFKMSGRTVIHRINFNYWPEIIDSAREIGLDQISFLPADVSSSAFNRATIWDGDRQNDMLPAENELASLRNIIDHLKEKYQTSFDDHFIAESPEKIEKIYAYYAAFHGHNLFPSKRCNAPWVSAVVESDGSVLPCFFHEAIGNIRGGSLDEILNSKSAIRFRKTLDMNLNETCKKCVCYLNLKPTAKI